MTFQINPPSYILKALECLESAHYEAYVVGGCVRDCLLKKEPHDWDICTNATPKEISQLFSQYPLITTGEKHGTISPIINHNVVDITTFRHDGTYSDFRHPDEVVFTSSLKEDLARRDFTINAMAWSPRTGLLDYYGGYNDILHKSICAVGTATERFKEDALRIMRCFRFCSILSFTPDATTLQAANELAPLLDYIAVERIQCELNQILCSDDVITYLQLFRPVLFQIIPELRPLYRFEQHTKYHQFDVWEHTLHSLAASPKELVFRLTMIFHDIGKPDNFTRSQDGVGHFKGHEQTSKDIAGVILKRLRYSNEIQSRVVSLIQYHSITIAPNKKSVRKWMSFLGVSLFFDLLQVMQADANGKSELYKKIQLEEIQQIKTIAEELLEEDTCLSLKQLEINGTDLLNIGFPKGSAIGSVLNELLQEVIDGTLENKKETLIQRANNIYKGCSN